MHARSDAAADGTVASHALHTVHTLQPCLVLGETQTESPGGNRVLNRGFGLRTVKQSSSHVLNIY